MDFETFRLKPDKSWKMRPVSSSMRKAHFILPSPDEGVAEAELIVYHFGTGQGGRAEDNITRWKKQFKRSPEMSPDELSERKSLMVNGLKVTVLEVRGTFLGASFRPTEPKPNYMMLAAVIETDGGFHYLKTTGPEKTVTHWKERWYEMVAAIEPKSKKQDA